MRQVFCSLFIIVAAAVAAAPGPNQNTAGIAAPPAGPSRTLTGVLSERVFIQGCNCFPWVVEKNGNASEMNVGAVSAAAHMLSGTRVRATGTWTTYLRGGRRVPYMIVTHLDPM